MEYLPSKGIRIFVKHRRLDPFGQKQNRTMIAKTMTMPPVIISYSTAGLLDCGDDLDKPPCRERGSVVAASEEN